MSGDDWEHDILIEDIAEPQHRLPSPRCLTGRRACPPEDCGGIWGYDYLIEILADPHHEEHEDRLEWLGLDSADQFDPETFDPAQVNSVLSARASRSAALSGPCPTASDIPPWNRTGHWVTALRSPS
ncbi:plasmid pRiA4b ORF-3 family protein [Streptomyces sp. NBC_00154]|uniref:plasmid pRiA4b ORF-3 family protein n=1 Tax=Streptomyces sp. NBC_00154 TaxID=2975670 RepID=UPI0022504DB2|nr:plasmid pRiA4b ORF-3 family protein [Streptomyces sp. NBC_00154]MCX5309392.1 plasmid pRiA4b ORF-3 family protein [Streptomyces sp. NBC_00154]